MELKNEIIEGSIEAIAFGGDGIMRHNGKAVFIPFTAIGDLVKARVIVDKKKFAKAHIQQLVKKSPHRVLPLCSHFSHCGGCQLQHLLYEQQLAIKEQFVKDALVHIGQFTHPPVESIVAAEKTVNYRRHIRLHLKSDKNIPRLGFIRHDNLNVEEIVGCALFDDLTGDVLLEIKELIHLLMPIDKLIVALYKGISSKFILDLQFSFLPKKLSSLMEKTLSKSSLIQGIIARDDKRMLQSGNGTASFQIEDLLINYNPLVFIQAHPEQSALLYHDLTLLTESIKPQKILDLYCGIGVTSLLLAKRGMQVLAIENNAHALKFAHENAKINELSSVSFECADVDQVIEKWLSSFNPDIVILNPPRTGLGKAVISALLEQKPKHLIYVSCMPATLARDLRILCQGGYNFVHSKPYDLFPQTTHVETLVYLKL